MNNLKLKPCPYCKENFMLHLHKPWFSSLWRIECGACLATSPKNTCKDIVVNAWNRRTK